MLLNPSANHVYRQATVALSCAELTVTAPFASEITPCRIGAADALGFQADEVDELVLAAQSAHLVTFRQEGDLLRPLDVPDISVMDDDLVTIPKYQGKTNEGFTRLLLHLTLSQVERPGPLEVLDPLAGRGTTLLAAWRASHHGFGVEADEKAFEALAGYLKTYLRTKRIKHTAQVTPVRREGRTLGRRLDAEARLGEATHDQPARPGMPTLRMTVFTGDTRDTAVLFGRKRFDAIVTDAPYGVVHGSEQQRDPNAGDAIASGKGRAGQSGRGGRTPRDRSPQTLLAEAIPVWRGQLKAGGALGISWNTHTLSRTQLLDIISQAGLQPRDEGPWRQFAHRVDASINRDLVVATAP